MNLNKVLVAGRLTRDVQLKRTPSGAAVADIGVAVNRTFTDASGQKREETCFVDVVLWRKQAELCHKYLRKGSPIFIEGRLTLDSWEDREGQRRSKLRVVADNFQFVGGDRAGREEFAQAPAAAAEAAPEAVPDDVPPEPAGDIPF
ncbi:MAG TPA: single-stranded DNA-binding protein [Planctomycetes bacterium]|nr:single-stranded DNA-binding protein [Planctomycetota bacterium]